jgi:glycine betaine catabolism A
VPARGAGRPPGRPGPQGRVVALPYHSWTYRLEGDLLRAPWSEEIDGFDQAAFGLHPVGVATWGGFVFLHLTPGEAVPLADQLGPVPDRLRRYPLEDLAVGRRLTYRVAANWKLVAENYNECYHCAGVHPELCRVVPAFKRGGAGLDWDRGIPHREGAWTFTATGKSDRAPFPGLDTDERTRHKGELVYPNLMLSLSADHVAAFTLWPHGPRETTVVCELLFHPDEQARPSFDRLLGPVDFLPVVGGGDSCRAAQAAPRRVPASPATARGCPGLTLPPQAFWVSASPAATRMLRAALASRS